MDKIKSVKPIFITESEKKKENPELKDLPVQFQPSWFRKIDRNKGIKK